MLLAHLTDLHVRPTGTPAYRIVDTNMLTERALRAVAALRPAPDAVIVSGDLTDCGLAEEYDLLAGMFGRYLSMPVYVIPGNHDRREVLKARLGHLPGIAGTGDFIQYVVDDLPVRLVMLDTVVPGFGHGTLCAERLAHLDETLAAEPERPTAIVMHHPPLVCGIEHMDRINLHAADAFAEVVRKHGQVERILCGHHHRPIVTRFAGTVLQVVPSIAHQVEFDLDADALPAFVMEPPAFQVHQWTPQGGLVSHGVYVESYPGPYPFVLDAAYPGAEGEASAARDAA
ncbi:phosphodiesterase [Microbaculum marinum]|uniref:Phosphodiesterase n=1 Tax=Microbaculum marinum TaxID=1764581 RepID=A0AAW9S0X2_9HYPH